MYTIQLETSFSAQHQLTYSNGKQEPLHEHDWKVCVGISAERLNEEELVMDFEELQSLLDTILQDFRGQRLETVGYFENRNTSAENVARIIYDLLAPKLPDTVHLDFAEVTEAVGCRARFSA